MDGVRLFMFIASGLEVDVPQGMRLGFTDDRSARLVRDDRRSSDTPAGAL